MWLREHILVLPQALVEYHTRYLRNAKSFNKTWPFVRVAWREERNCSKMLADGGGLFSKEKDLYECYTVPNHIIVECGRTDLLLHPSRENDDLHDIIKSKYVDTSVQKGGIPGFSGCVEHTSAPTQLLRENQSKGPYSSMDSTLQMHIAPSPTNLLMWH
jgi:hypothetical protein